MQKIKIIYLCICLLLFVSPSLAMDEISCKAPPKYVQIHYHFDWELNERQALSDSLKLQCGEDENIDFLRQKIERSIGSIGKVNLRANQHQLINASNIEFEIVTEQVQSKNGVTLFEIHHSINDSELISYLDVTGQPVEGKTLKANFAYNIDFVENHNAKIKVQWFRNGKPIKNATKASYEITEEDVYQEIKVIAKIYKNQNVIAFRAAEFEKVIKIGPKLPVIKDIKISGEPIIGNKLALSYKYEDLNSGDLEGKSKIKWLRDNQIIANEKNITYTVTRKDKGHIISAEVEPVTIEGEKGYLSRVSMKGKVVDPIDEISFKINNLFPNDEWVAEVLLADTNLNPDSAIDKIVYRTQIEDRISISKNLKIKKHSPKQFVGFTSNIVLKNHDNLIKQLEAEFFGQEINLYNLEELSQRAKDIADRNSDAKFHVSIPPQVIENGIVDLEFSIVPISKSNKTESFVKKVKNKNIKEFWLWGFAAHYLRLFL